MNTLPIAQKIQAKYLRAVNNEMIGNYQHSIVVHIMRRIVKLIFETPDFAIDLPIEPRWRDYYITALQISAYLSYVQYEVIANDTIAHISLTDRYRAQILAAATPPPTDTAPTPAPSPAECSESPAAPSASAPAPSPAECSESPAAPSASAPAPTPAECSESATAAKPPTTDNAAPAPTPAECSECSEYSEPPTAAATDNAALFECSESASSATDNATPTPECSECSEPPIAAANFRLKAVTTASLEGSLCISRGQGRRGRPQPSDSHQLRIKSERRHLAPHKPPTTPSATPQPHPPRPPTTRLSAALS